MTLPRKLLSYGMNELHEDHSFRGGSQSSFSSWSIPTTSGFVWPRKVPHITPMSPHPTQTNEPSSKGSPRDKSGFVSPRNPKLLQLLGFPEKNGWLPGNLKNNPKAHGCHCRASSPAAGARHCPGLIPRGSPDMRRHPKMSRKWGRGFPCSFP